MTKGDAKSYEVRFIDMCEHEDSYGGVSFPSREKAIAHAQGVITSFLKKECKTNMSAADLFDRFMHFGEDAFVVTPGGAPEAVFNGQDFARQECQRLCARPAAFEPREGS